MPGVPIIPSTYALPSRMARIVLTTVGSYGDLHPYIALGLGLLSRGHTVAIATSESYQAKVVAEGLQFSPVRPNLDDFGPFAEVARRVYDPAKGAQYMVRELLLPSLANSFDDLHAAVRDADLLVTHTLSYAGHLLGHNLPIPWVSTVLSPMVFMSGYDPPPLPPAPWLQSLYRLNPSFYRLVFSGLKAWARGWSAPVRRFCKERGLPEPTQDPLFEGQFSPRMTLAMFSPLLAHAQPDWPSNTHLTGFPLYDMDEVQVQTISALDAFIDGGEPPIVFTLGSSAIYDAGDFYRQAVHIAHRLGRRAVLLTGKFEENQRLPLLAPTIHVADYVPHSYVFPRAAAVVHQGGIGTLGQAMHAGRPMLVVPFSHDQPDNAQRVERMGIGKRIPRAKFSVSSAEAALRELLEDGRYAVNATEIARRLREEDGVAAACDRLESVLG